MPEIQISGGTIVLLVIFMSFFIIMLAYLPIEMILAQPKQFYEYGHPESWNPDELGIGQFEHYLEYNVTKGIFNPVTYDFEAEGQNFTLVLRIFFLTSDNLNIEHLYWYWGPLFQWDAMQIVTKGDHYLEYGEAYSRWNSAENQSENYPIFCDHKTGITLIVKDHNATRNNLQDSWNDGILTCGIGFGFFIDQRPTAVNAWALIGQLLSFQAPQMFGMTGMLADVINTLLSLALWTILCAIIVGIIAKVLPFVG